MRITGVRAVPVRVPRRATFESALGTHEVTEAGIVVVQTDEGIRGHGEISLVWHGNGARLCRDVEELVGPAIVGLDVFALTRVMAATRAALEFGRHTVTVCAAVEMALLDAQGRALGVTVVDLLGGVGTERVPLSMSLSMAPVPDVLEQARGYLDQGFHTVKVKSARDAEHLLAVVAGLREEFGDALGIRVDLNMACRQVKEALSVVLRLEPLGVLSVEQPLAVTDLDGMALLRERTTVPIMADESVWTPEDAWWTFRAGAADLVNVYVAEAGGPTRARIIAELCHLANAGVAVGSMPELGIGTAAAAHFACSVPGLEHPSDVAGLLYHADDVAVVDISIHDGYLWPPTEPGLGVELDEDRLARYALAEPEIG
jgi:L-alanine-DL-glutamate epimerase-like enolase superfamily enzyme